MEFLGADFKLDGLNAHPVGWPESVCWSILFNHAELGFPCSLNGVHYVMRDHILCGKRTLGE